MKNAMLVGGPLHGKIVTVTDLSSTLEVYLERYLPHSGTVRGTRPEGFDGFLLAETEFPAGSLAALFLDGQIVGPV